MRLSKNNVGNIVRNIWAIQHRNEEAATGVRTEKGLRLEREEKEQQERMEKRMERERERLALQHEPEMKKLEVHMKLGLDLTSEKVQ